MLFAFDPKQLMNIIAIYTMICNHDKMNQGVHRKLITSDATSNASQLNRKLAGFFRIYFQKKEEVSKKKNQKC